MRRTAAGVPWLADLTTTSYDSEYQSFATSSYAVSISPDGAYLNVLTDSNVYQWNLTTANDVSDGAASSSIFTGIQGFQQQGLCFAKNHAKMYTYASGPDRIYEYDVSNPALVSSASYTSRYKVLSGQDGNINGIHVTEDGAKLFAVGLGSDKIYAYTFGTPYDVTTLTYDGVSLSVSGQQSNPNDVTVSPDGLHVYITGRSPAAVHGYPLTSARDLSSWDSTTTSFIVSEETFPQGIAFSNDGAKMFITGNNQKNIYQYTSG